MKYLVTGAGGFLGTEIAKQLIQKGHEVINFSRSTYPHLNELGIETINGSVTEYESVKMALNGVDGCFHVASKVAMWGKWEDFYQTNVIGTKNIIKACEENNVKNLVYTSTPSVVFGNKGHSGSDESIKYPKKYLSLYAKSKSIAENQVLNSESLNTISIRPHLILGPNDTNLVPRLVEKAKSNKLFIVGNGTNKVDVVHVVNAALAHILAMEKLEQGDPQVNHQAFFIGQGPVNLWNFINQILESKNVPQIKKSITSKKAYIIGSILEKIYSMLGKFDREPPMTRFVALQLSENHYFSHQKAKDLLGWKELINADNIVNNI